MDNRYFNYKCPPLMQDGRFITNYLDNSIFEQYIRNVNNINSAQDYKRFLQNNGDTIINRERAYLESINTCAVHGKCMAINDKISNCGCGNNKI
jgi:hypothetical protein